jgi:4-hydroxybenzoate polyprenyltransferase
MKRWMSLVKFAHTVFALPFALLGYVYALVSTSTPPSWVLVGEILLCMVFARNAAMGFNRWADRRFDAENPRTAGRDIPAGRVSPRAAMWFVILNAAAFMAVAACINPLTLILAPVALAVILGYSYTKRFTALSHVVLGLALAIAPAGAYIAVAGSVDVAVAVLSAVVVMWVAGFDILYSMQDAAHDRSHGLHSIPARFSAAAALASSIGLHVLALGGGAVFGLLPRGGGLYWTGAV